MDLQHVSAVISGGVSGLGEAVARKLTQSGARVTVLDVNEAAGQALAAEIGCHFVRTDVTDKHAVRAAFEEARKVNGQERITVNCAGIGIVHKTARRSRSTGEIVTFPFADYDKVIQVNLLGTFYCAATSAEGMLTLDPLSDGERGVIINTASIAALEGESGQAAYSASKAGVLGMTLPLARDFKDEGIRVNAILPGNFDTPLLATARPDILQRLIDAVPFPKRLGRPEEFARLVVDLCENRYLNGENVRIDGATRL